MARRTVVDEWRNAAAPAIGICKIRCRGSAGASRRSRPDAPVHRPVRWFRCAAPAGDRPSELTSQLIGFSMVAIFVRSLVYNVLFYLLLAFWVFVGIPTYLMPRWAIMTIA